MFEIGDWEFVLKVGVTIVIKQIDHFLACLHFVSTRFVQGFMQRENLKKLNNMELVVIGIYGRSTKTFILVIADFIMNSMHNKCNLLSCIILVALQQCWSRTLEAIGLMNISW
jgi:hypothetical protein